MTAHPHPFDRLTPQAVLDALDDAGVRGDGRMLQLNSYENRVFQLMLEDGGAVVAKFYRPGRWSDAQILEEHEFALALAAAEVPVVAPMVLADGRTLAHARVQGEPFRLAVYPCCAGHGPDLERPDTLRRLGRFIARLHTVGEQQPFVHRRRLDPAVFGHAAVKRLLALDEVVPAGERDAWADASTQALAAVDSAFANCPAQALRLHGDCHPGNILWRDADQGGAGPQIVDLDDAVTGPAVQDLWMLLSGDAPAMRGQLLPLLAGYREFRRFDARELALVEPLRPLRMVHHSTWLAERWSDPAFPVAFPWFASGGYWRQQTTELHEQIAAMAAPPLDEAGWAD